MWDKSLIDKIAINFREADDKHIGIHAFKRGHSCRYFEIPAEWADEPEFFSRVYELLLKVWELPDELSAPCPVCGSELHLFERRYKSLQFCGFCGSYYERRERDGAKKIVVLARRDEVRKL